jgi:hypothetical protein
MLAGEIDGEANCGPRCGCVSGVVRRAAVAAGHSVGIGAQDVPGFIEQEPVTVAPADVALAAFHLSRYVRSEAEKIAK